MGLKARIMDIKHFAVHDGDGIRTTVFFKGCPLRCVWCHNPEGLSALPSYSFIEKKCIGCGECAAVCHSGAHIFENGKHDLRRELCSFCGACENACLGEAIRIYGKTMTVDELMPEVLKDRIFYETSGGGVTVSGGECLMQAEFCGEFLEKLKLENINTAVDTCGYVPRTAIDRVMPFTDVFLYDVKAFDERTHINATGVSNKPIMENLFYIDSQNKKTEIRIPFVPEYNMEEIPQIGSMLSRLKNVVRVRVLPYHNLAGSKYEALGDYTHKLPELLPTKEQLFAAENTLRQYGLNVE